jgi:hypothetical protein
LGETARALAALLIRADILPRLAKLVALVLEAISFAIAIGIHMTLNYLANALFHSKFPLALEFLDVVFTIAFSVIYIQLTYDMVLVFVPWLRPRQKSPVVEQTAVVKPE